jgi:RNA polymerase sigma factor (TIGR02999 family)
MNDDSELAHAAVPPWGPQLYDELRRVADLLFSKERPDHTLQPTALVHEAFLRLEQSEAELPTKRSEALAYAAAVMRRLLVEHARKRATLKRGGDRERSPFVPSIAIAEASLPDVLTFNEAIDRLAERYPREARVVELRFFGGMTVEEVADLLDLPPRTVREDWRIAKARLMRVLDEVER